MRKRRARSPLLAAAAALVLGAEACGRAREGSGDDGPGAERPHDVARAPAVHFGEGPQLLEGMLSVLPEGLVFIECRTGAAFPLTRDGAYREVEEVYRRGLGGADRPGLVRIRGRLAPRSEAEGGEKLLLTAEAFEEFEPRAGCGEAVADMPLEGTEWVLVELEGAPLPAGLEATLRLEREEGAAVGIGGCLRVRAPYRLEGGRLTLGDMTPAPRVCATLAPEVERAYLSALGRVGGYRLVGDGLELLSAEGVVARFRSR